MTDATVTRPLAETAGANMICFWLAGQQFGVQVEHVKETIVLRPITRVFLTPDWVSGIINLRGDVVAVLDLSAFLGMAKAQVAPETRVVIARCAGRTAGLIVDRLAEVQVVAPQRLEPVPQTVPGDVAGFLLGVVTLDGGAPLMVLDLHKLFESERLLMFARRG